VSDYRRPTLPLLTYHDEKGALIEYGARWKGDSPPEEAYSRTSNLERVLPLHSVAQSLCEWLEATFEVAVEHDPAVAVDLLHAPADIVGAMRLIPNDASAAPLTFVMTSLTGVYVHAGLLQDFRFPVCVCDACDEDVLGLADELEWTVRTVVAGGYSEWFEASPSPWIASKREDSAGRMRGSRSRFHDLPIERVTNARARLPHSGRWVAWPEKS